MRFQKGVALGLVLATGCGHDGTPLEAGLTEGRQISGQVVTVTFQPDSSYVGVPGVQLIFVRTSTDSGNPTNPPDSMFPLMSQGRFVLRADSGWIDTMPGDTTQLPPPPDTLPTDTLLPPPLYCGAPGDTVATGVTDATGHFTVGGLSGGTYDIVAVPPAGFGANMACRVDLGSQSSAEVQIFVPPRPQSTQPAQRGTP